MKHYSYALSRQGSFAAFLSLGLLLCFLPPFATAGPSRPVAVPEDAVLQVRLDEAFFDNFGEQVAQDARNKIPAIIGKAGGTAFDFAGLGIIEGTKKPEAYACYVGCFATEKDGQGAIALDYVIRARVKVDVGGWPVGTTKVAEVGVWQLLRAYIVPTMDAGRLSFDKSSIVIVKELTEKGGSAKTEHLERLREQVRDAFVDRRSELIVALNAAVPSQVQGHISGAKIVKYAPFVGAKAAKVEAERTLFHKVRGDLALRDKIGVGPNHLLRYAEFDLAAEITLAPGGGYTGGSSVETRKERAPNPLYLWGSSVQGAGPGARQYYMQAIAPGSSITGVIPFTGRCCDNFIFVLNGGQSHAPATPKQILGADPMKRGFNDHVGGAEHQRQVEIPLRDGEYILGYQLRFGRKTDSIRFLLSSGRSVGVPGNDQGRPGLLIGGPGGAHYSDVFEAPKGYELVGLKVNGAGATVDSIRGLFRLRSPPPLPSLETPPVRAQDLPPQP